MNDTHYIPLHRGVVWVLGILSAVGVILGVQYISDWRKTNDVDSKVMKEAVSSFEKQLHYRDLDEGQRQGFIDTITKNRGWDIAADTAEYQQTGFFSYPLTATQVTHFQNPTNSKVGMLKQQLFIYDFDRKDWLPLAWQIDTISDDKIVNTEQTDLWKNGNDLAEVYGR